MDGVARCERNQASQAEYKKFVYSPREKLSLQAGKRQAAAGGRNDELTQSRERNGKEESEARRNDGAQIVDDAQVEAVGQLVAGQPPREKEVICIGIVGEKGTGKSCLKKYLEEKGGVGGHSDGVCSVWLNNS